MRESRGKIWRKFYVLGSWENHSNDMCCNILWYDWNSLLCLKKFCYSMFLCLVDFSAVFLFCFVCTNVAFKYFLILWFFTRNLLISFRCFRLNVRWRIIGFCFTYRSFTFTVFFSIKIFFLDIFFTRDLPFFNNLNPQNQIFYRHPLLSYFLNFINFLVEVIYNLILSNICKNIQLFLNILTISQ